MRRTLCSIVGDVERDDDRRVEGADPAAVEIAPGVEDETVQAGDERRLFRHQGAQSSVRISFAVSNDLPFARLAAPFEHNPDPDGRPAYRCVEHVCGDSAHEGIVACWFKV